MTAVDADLIARLEDSAQKHRHNETLNIPGYGKSHGWFLTVDEMDAVAAALRANVAAQELADEGEKLDWYSGYGRCHYCGVDRDSSVRKGFVATAHLADCLWAKFREHFPLAAFPGEATRG